MLFRKSLMGLTSDITLPHRRKFSEVSKIFIHVNRQNLVLSCSSAVTAAENIICCLTIFSSLSWYDFGRRVRTFILYLTCLRKLFKVLNRKISIALSNQPCLCEQVITEIKQVSLNCSYIPIASIFCWLYDLPSKESMKEIFALLLKQPAEDMTFISGIATICCF